MPNSDYKLLISGFIGAGNFGDELILAVLIDQIRKRIEGSVKFSVLSFNPEETRNFHNVEAVFRPDFSRLYFKPKVLWNLIRYIIASDGVLIGGGGLLQDLHSYLTIPRYLHTAILAKLFKKQIFYVGLGIGPVRCRIAKKLIRICLKNADFISVRDKASKDFLEKLGLESNKINLAIDPVLMIAEHPEVHRYIRKDSNNKKKPTRFAIAVRDFRLNNLNVTILARLFDYISEELGAEVVFVSMNPNLDQKAGKRVIQRMRNDAIVLNKLNSPIELIKEFVKYDVIISMRLHGAICGIALGIPTIGLSYDDKVKNFFSSLGISEFCLELSQLDYNKLRDLVNFII